MNIINNLNQERLKKLAQTKFAKLAGKHPLVLAGAAVGLGFYLFSNSHNSKKQNQSGW